MSNEKELIELINKLFSPFFNAIYDIRDTIEWIPIEYYIISGLFTGFLLGYIFCERETTTKNKLLSFMIWFIIGMVSGWIFVLYSIAMLAIGSCIVLFEYILKLFI